ncbi:hypothetical protein CMEL01_12869 [Colletotrichum melonis]|uniref:Uncharacterized protein n=1 Tax=Colletotrichum melonis TaxID=1209925 RepID=A0AAI9USV5_9PEZI|nr:hypothetical protein CMEL01_12869 [Colletotrichum melonis]
MTSLHWNATSRATELRYVSQVIVEAVYAFANDCTQYFTCHAIVYPNPNISGRGVLTAFVVSAYLVLALIIWAYWYGTLPEGLVRKVDRRLFFARKQQLNDKWTRMLVELVLTFSDQQLLTGLAILVAGYVQALGANLSIYHWNTVIYLAWLSSTVHLMSLSVLRDRLGTNKILRFIRLFVMISILGLLLAALVPTITNGWPSSTATFRWWDWVRFWGRARVECFLEETAKRILQERPRWHTKAPYKTVVSTYVAFVALMELLESFMLTMLLLAFTLAWGTYQLFHSENQVGEEIRSAEREMGFGQLLPILLLSQPMFVAVQIYLGK